MILCLFQLVYVIVGETLFNVNHPSEPPDFIFNGSDHQFRPDIADIKVSTVA